jgi:mono/diheme cytochrome c family protein
MTVRNRTIVFAPVGVALVAAASITVIAFSAQAQDMPGSGPSNVRISTEGKQVYEQICQSCHMADGKGGGGAAAKIPALVDNARLADPDYSIAILLKGKGGMPWFTDLLTPAQMAAVITYVRSHFNKYPDPVTEADVKKLASGSAPMSDCNCAQ